MSKSLCIISPDDKEKNNLFYFELYPNQYREDVLIEYCNNKNLPFNDVISIAANGYLYIPIEDDLCLIFSPNNLAKAQMKVFLEFMCELYNRQSNSRVNVVKTNERGEILTTPTKINNYDELLEFFNISKEERKTK